LVALNGGATPALPFRVPSISNPSVIIADLALYALRHDSQDM
jgi:hypothetical protein